jgi:hypothetical protein
LGRFSGLVQVRRANPLGWLDLRVYRDSFHEYVGARPLYALRVTEADLPFTYPPVAILVLAPLAWLPFPLSAASLLVLSGAAVLLMKMKRRTPDFFAAVARARVAATISRPSCRRTLPVSAKCTSCSRMMSAARITVSGNTLSGIFDSAALFANSVETFTFSGNTVNGGASGIRINAGAINGTIERNVVSGATNALHHNQDLGSR